MIKRIPFYLALVLILVGCVQHQDEKLSSVINVVEAEEIIIEYAEGFDVVYHEDYVKILTHSLDNNEPFSDSVFILKNNATTLSGDHKIIASTDNKFACQSSTYLAFLDELASLDEVVALCGIEYVNNPKVTDLLATNEVVELCFTDQVQLEALYESNSDLFLVYPFGGGQNENYKEKGIKTLLIAEYLERTQLARLEWIKLFGLLTGKSKEANAYFDQIEKEYLSLKEGAVSSEKTFIMNLPFSEQWYMPSSKSVGVELIEDAGIKYFYRNETGTENMMHSNEQVWEDGESADYWLIIASRPVGFGIEELIAEAEVYKEFKSVQNKQVIFCNTLEVDYFSKGVVEPNIILKDLLYATGQIQAYEPSYFFRLE